VHSISLPLMIKAIALLHPAEGEKSQEGEGR